MFCQEGGTERCNRVLPSSSFEGVHRARTAGLHHTECESWIKKCVLQITQPLPLPPSTWTTLLCETILLRAGLLAVRILWYLLWHKFECGIPQETECTTVYREDSTGTFLGDTQCKGIPVEVIFRQNCGGNGSKGFQCVTDLSKYFWQNWREI